MPQGKPQRTRRCYICGERYLPACGPQRYCSDECRAAAYVERLRRYKAEAA